LVQTRRVIDLVAIQAAANDQIAQMLLIAVRAGDVPAAPAFFEWSGLIDAIRARRQNGQAAGIGKNRPHHMAGNFLRLRGPMTDQAVVGLPAKVGC
jgi:hypothetical protein